MTDNEWWGPDLTHPKDPPERMDPVFLSFYDLFIALGKAYSGAFRLMYDGMKPLVELVDHIHTTDHHVLVGLDLNKQTRKRSRDPSCHKRYPTSDRPDHKSFIVKMNTRPPKMRYRNRR